MSETKPEATIEISAINVAYLHEWEQNCRRRHNEARDAELLASIRERGVIFPLIARPHPRDRGHYQLVDGARRLRAIIAAGIETVSVVVREMSDIEALETMVTANEQREDLHPLDAAEGYKALLDVNGYAIADIASKIGKSPAYVVRRIKLLDLCAEAQRLFLEEKITVSHAECLAPLQPDDQMAVIKAALHTTEYTSSGTFKGVASVARLRQYIDSNILRDLKKVPWDVKDAELVPSAGACTTCPKKTGNAPDLFGDVKRKDVCSDPACFAAKLLALVDSKRAALVASGVEVRLASSQMGSAPKGMMHVDNLTRATRSCESTHTALIALGPNVGDTFKICETRGCKHHADATKKTKGAQAPETNRDIERHRASQRAREKKTQAERAFRMALLEAIRAKVPAALDEDDVVDIIMGFLPHVYSDLTNRLFTLWLGKAPKPEFGRRDRALKDILAKAAPKERLIMLVDMTLGREVWIHPGSIEETPTLLLSFAKRYGIDVAAVRKKSAPVQKTGAAAPKKRKALRTKKVKK